MLSRSITPFIDETRQRIAINSHYGVYRKVNQDHMNPILDSITTSKDEDFMDNETIREEFDSFLQKANIYIDENGNFECYIIIDESDTEHNVGSIFNNTPMSAWVYIEESYNALKMPVNQYSFGYIQPMRIMEKESVSIIDDLLKIEKRMIKILVNRNNVIGVTPRRGLVDIDKYQVIEIIKLNPKIAIRLLGFDIISHYLSVSLYNTITRKSRFINIKFSEEDTDESIKSKIGDYLELDKKQVELQNKLRDQVIY